MKILVVYYSLDGNTRLLAKAVAEETGADILELRPKKSVRSGGFMKYFWGGRQAMMREKPELYLWNKNPEEYDLLFIGTPVWVYRYAPPLHTFFSSVKMSNKKIALFCCHGGNMGKTFKEMAAALKGNEIIGQIDFEEPIANGPETAVKKIKNWARGLIGS